MVQLSAVVLLALAASTQAAPNVTSTNGTNATSTNGTNATSTNGTNATSTNGTKNATSSSVELTNPPEPTDPPRSLPQPGGSQERTSDRKLTVGLELPEGKTFADVHADLHDAIETHIIVAGEAKKDIETIIEQVSAGSKRDAQVLGEIIQIAISFRDIKTGLSAEETLRRKCVLDNLVVELEKQIADENSPLRQAIPYLTGSASSSGVVSSICSSTRNLAPIDADDGLSGGAIAGIVVGSLVLVGIIAAVVVVVMKKPEAQTLPNEPIAA
eukprot:TRINITY_DN551_c0_g5_i1.p2 TRINITY_DN551_c0_g5~~TRINITY_DN551_c0_g5_i1.p2  ORF type:complete len:271 (+),score=88.94 TRINITY_DN551_c0_g5_i1:55-867(+)